MSFGWKVGYGGCFWVGEGLIALVPTRRGAWFMSSNALLHKGLSNAILKRYGLVVPSNLAACR